MSTNYPTVTNNGSGQVLKDFQLEPLSIKAKSDDAYGIQIAKYIESTIGGGLAGYYFSRNLRIRTNRDYANGVIDVRAMFADRLQFNGKTNYANIGWQPIQIVNRIISGLVGRWMSRNEKIKVTAIDTLSIKEKQEEYKHLQFIIDYRKMLEKLEQDSGVQMIPHKEIPADEEELNLWASQFQRIPEEILYEFGCNDVLSANGFFGPQKEKVLHDSAEAGFVGTYTWMDDNGVIHVERVKPENALYSYSELDDLSDTKWRGRVISMRISDIRRKYGKEFGGKLTEKQMYEIACMSKDYQITDKLTWMVEWDMAFLRPYDEWNVDVIEFELRSVDNEAYTVTKTKFGSTYVNKGMPKTKAGQLREKPLDNQEVINDTKQNIYRGVYIRSTQTLLEWGLKKNMIRPDDPIEVGNAEFSYSFYMYQNYKMRNIALPQKIEEPVQQMILARLKMEQLVARMRPTGAAIDSSALDNVDYGLGDKNKDIDYKKLYDQTGDIYYRGVDAEGKRVPVPITELANSGFLGQLQGLILIYDKHYQILKDELGEDPALITQAVQPRVTTGNIDSAQRMSENATDYMYRAYSEVMKQTGKKISCLLKDSVTYGSKVYRNLMNEEDVAGRIFTTDIKFLPTEVELAKMEQMLNNAITANPILVTYLDPFQIMRIAKENISLAEKFFRNAQRKMHIGEMQKSQAAQQQQIEGNIAVTQKGEEAKQETERVKGDVEVLRAKLTGEYQNKSTILASLLKIREQGLPIPAEWQGVERILIQNVAVPAALQTQDTIKGQQQTQMAEQQAMQQQQQQQMMGEEQQQTQQQPQQNIQQQQVA